jgi:hypothetical protein
MQELANAIRSADRRAGEQFTGAFASCIEAGKALIVAKAQCQHGEWTPFVHDQCQMTMMRAQRYMRIAKAVDQLAQGVVKIDKNGKATRVTPMTQRRALRLLSAPKSVRRKKRVENVKPATWEE